VVNLIKILLLAGALLLSACGEKAATLHNGEPAPAFALPDLQGNTLTFPDDLQGPVTVIRFWADWCPFCKTEMKALEPAYQALKAKGVRILAINVRQDRATAASFIDKLGISYEVLLDEEGEVARRYGVLGLPSTFFVDGKGLLRTRIIGESTPEDFTSVVNELLPP